MWNVLHSWAIPLGAAAVCLPVVIHLLTRPKPVRLPLSTLRFVREAVEQKRARSRLRDWLVLALRTLAVALLAAALARPLIGTHEADDDAPDQATRVVLVDVSQSMAAGDHGISAWERARALAARHLQFRPGLRTNLILAGASARSALDAPSGNFTALAEELTRAAVRPERIDVKAALEASARMLTAGLPAQPELIVISDFQRTNWAVADFAGLPRQTRIVLQSVAPPQPPPNLAIVRVGSAGNAAGQEAVLEVEVANFSPAPQTVNVELEWDSQLHRLTGVCGAQARLTFTRPLGPSRTGWHSGMARLAGAGDSLNADNSRPLVVDVRRPPKYLLVTRQSASQRPSSSYYLERALVPLEHQGNNGPRLIRLDPVRLDLETLAPADLIILDHPGKLPASATSLLASLVRRGRALLYVTAERVDATNLKLLLDSAGAAVHLPVEFVPAPSSQARRDLFLTAARRDQPPFAIFGESLPGLLAPLRFAGGLASRRVEGGLADDVLAGYSDGSVCLVHAACGAGQLAILNADLEVSTLPASPTFVPWLAELTRRLLERGAMFSEVASGEPAAVYLPPDAGPVVGLTSAMDGSSLVDEGAAVLWRIPAAGPPGAYQVKRGGEVVRALATVIPSEESDLRPLPPEVFQQRLAGGRDVRYRSANQPQDDRDTLWTWLLVGCVGCMLGEIVVLSALKT